MRVCGREMQGTKNECASIDVSIEICECRCKTISLMC